MRIDRPSRVVIAESARARGYDLKMLDKVVARTMARSQWSRYSRRTRLIAAVLLPLVGAASTLLVLYLVTPMDAAAWWAFGWAVVFFSLTVWAYALDSPFLMKIAILVLALSPVLFLIILPLSF